MPMPRTFPSRTDADALSDSQTQIEMVKLDRPRAVWRQRLVDAEAGFRFGLRTESTLYVTLFGVVAVAVAAGVLRVSLTEAAILTVAVSQSVVCTFMRLIVTEATGAAGPAHRLASAAALLSAAAAIAVAALLLVPKITAVW